MAYFEWGDDMVIDNGPIDRDHRKMVDLINELHTATTQGDGKTVVRRILSDVVSHTKDHLVREEQEMERLNFPHQEKHKGEHVLFMNELQQLVDKQADGSITVASQLSSLLRDWLSLHIRRTDHELRVHVKNVQSRKK